MSNTPPNHPNDTATAAMAALLASDASPEEFTRRLLAINIEQARALDAELPELLRACAIPRQFDAEIIGVLRDASDDTARNEALLEQIRSFSFVRPHAGGGYVYHDNVRDVLLEEWQTAPSETHAVLTQRLATLYLRRGKEALEAKEYETALAAYSAAIELAPENGEAYAGRGVAHFALKDYKTALPDLTKVIELQPEDGIIVFMRGQTLNQMEDYSAALADFTRAIELQPDDGDNHYWRGVAYYELKDYSSALADFTRAVELKPNDGDN